MGVSSFGAEEVQEWGVQRTAELLGGKLQKVHWYSLFDLPRAWPATTRHREAEGSAYYRHFYMGNTLTDREYVAVVQKYLVSNLRECVLSHTT